MMALCSRRGVFPLTNHWGFLKCRQILLIRMRTYKKIEKLLSRLFEWRFTSVLQNRVLIHFQFGQLTI